MLQISKGMKDLKSYIIDGISTMNLNLIDVLIEENSILNDSSKEIWLDKFNILFKYFKNFNILKLEAQLVEEIYEHSIIVLFYNNDLNKPFYFKLKIEYTACFLTHIEQVDSQLKISNQIISPIYEIKLLFFKDDLINFKPSMKYYNEVVPYKNAVELFWPRLNDVVVTHNQLVEWLDEHIPLYDNLNPKKLHYKFQYYFFKLYNFFNDLENCLDQDSEYEAANDDFLQIEKNDSIKLKEWFENYDYLYYDVKCLDNYQIPKEYFIIGNKQELVKVNYEFNILTYAYIYNNIIQFKLNIESIAGILELIDPALEDY